MRKHNPSRLEAFVTFLVFATCLLVSTVMLIAVVVGAAWEYLVFVILLDVTFVVTTLFSYERYKEVSDD